MAEQPAKGPAPDENEEASEAKVEASGASPSEKVDEAGASPATKVSRVALLLIAIMFAWHLVSDRVTPHSGLARVQLYFVPVVPQVSGYINEVPVSMDQNVEAGQVIAQINPHPFELSVQSAEANFDLQGQNLRAGAAGVESAVSVLATARTQLDNAQRNLRRVEAVRRTDPGAISLIDYDGLVATRNSARSNVAKAEADVSHAREALGVEGAANPAMRAAVAQLETARFNLDMTTLRAPMDGRVADLRLIEGQFASTGQPMATLIVTKDAWLRVPMRENNLVYLRPGHRVEVVLDGAPGHIFQGRVASIGRGVSQGEAPRGELPDESGATGWFTDPQLYPVIVRLSDDVPQDLLRAGAKASVTAYTGDHSLTNSIAWFLMQVDSYVAYLN